MIGQTMEAQQRLDAAQTATREGRYAEALAQFLWFHHHALVEMPSMYGVRRSFALSSWKELANVYPDAMRALENERAQAAKALLHGEADIEAFRDVVAIDRYLNGNALSYAMYVELAAAQPVLAKQCANAALPFIVAAKDYQLAAQIMDDAEARIAHETDRFNHEIRRLQGRPVMRVPQRWAVTRICSNGIGLVLDILHGSGRDDEARRLRARALKLIQSPSARRAVDDALVHPNRPPPTDRRELRKLERLYGKSGSEQVKGRRQ